MHHQDLLCKAYMIMLQTAVLPFTPLFRTLCWSCIFPCCWGHFGG